MSLQALMVAAAFGASPQRMARLIDAHLGITTAGDSPARKGGTMDGGLLEQVKRLEAELRREREVNTAVARHHDERLAQLEKVVGLLAPKDGRPIENALVVGMAPSTDCEAPQKPRMLDGADAETLRRFENLTASLERLQANALGGLAREEKLEQRKAARPRRRSRRPAARSSVEAPAAPAAAAKNPVGRPRRRTPR